VTASRKPQQRPHWYRIHVGECPVCGYGDVIRERVYGKKPKDPAKRHTYTRYACGGHFA
jgi:hypothetical protein